MQDYSYEHSSIVNQLLDIGRAVPETDKMTLFLTRVNDSDAEMSGKIYVISRKSQRSL